MASRQAVYADLADRLLAIEQSLRDMGLWESESPPPEALQSTQPFCIDTLDFHQWLQFVFIERVQVMIALGESLPAQSGIAPLAEEWFKQREEYPASLIRALRDIDRLITDN